MGERDVGGPTPPLDSLLGPPRTLPTIDNQGDVSKPVLLPLFIQSVQDHFVMLRKLLKAFHRLFGLHGRRVALQKRSMIMYTP